MSEPGWELYRSYLAVLRSGSLSAAARRLGLTQPTLGRHIQELEAALGRALFSRSPQGLSPTDTALALQPHAEAMEAAAAALARAASTEADAVSGVVRITASEVIGVEVLPPMLADFKAREPGLVFELALSNATQDLLRRDADVAVRMTPPQQAALVAKKVGRVELGMYARRDYLDRCGVPETLEALRGHALIGFDRDLGPARSIGGLPMPITRELFALRSDNDHAQLAAIRSGFGPGVAQVPLAARDPRLVRLLPEALGFHLDIWIVMHEDLRTSRPVRAVFDALVQAFTTYASEGGTSA